MFMKDSLVRAVERVVAAQQLVPRGETIVVGVSGGIDSVVLAHLLHTLAPTWQWRLIFAHVNYGLRGRASDADAALVRALAKSLGWPCHVKTVGRKGPGVTSHVSRLTCHGNFQSWARDLRYRFFARIARQRGATVVTVAHQREDQCETILLNLIRGTGAAGLQGMRSTRVLADRVRLVRPLLHTSRAELLAYARRHRLAYRRDRSNRSVRYQRNRVRLQLLPLLRALNPQAVAHVCALGERMGEESAVMEAFAITAHERCRGETSGTLDRTALVRLPVALRRRVLRLAYAEVAGTLHGLTRDHLEHMDAIATGHGGQYSLPGPIMYRREGHHVCLVPGGK